LTRFARDRDQEAFGELVRRHGPMVRDVCRRMLKNEQDAEDAFQATFLVLAKKAGSLARPELLASWLYGVAYRTALRSRAGAARRSQAEGRGGAMLAVAPPLDRAWRGVQAALDEEINRLDEKHRAPLVLCYLEGKTHQEAARQLGCPLGSMSWRVH